MQAIKSRPWAIVSAVLLLLALGFLAGALSMNLYQRRRGHYGPPRQVVFQQALKQLNLSAEQQTKVDSILADTRTRLKEIRKDESPKVSEIRKQARERLQSVLTPEQWNQLQEQMKNSRDDRPRDRSSLFINSATE